MEFKDAADLVIKLAEKAAKSEKDKEAIEMIWDHLGGAVREYGDEEE